MIIVWFVLFFFLVWYAFDFVVLDTHPWFSFQILCLNRSHLSFAMYNIDNDSHSPVTSHI